MLDHFLSDMDDLRDKLNELHDLRETEAELREGLVQEARKLSECRRRIQKLMNENRQLKGE